MRLRVPAPRETIMIWEYGGAGGGGGERERERDQGMEGRYQQEANCEGKDDRQENMEDKDIKLGFVLKMWIGQEEKWGLGSWFEKDIAVFHLWL